MSYKYLNDCKLRTQVVKGTFVMPRIALGITAETFLSNLHHLEFSVLSTSISS